MTVKAQALKSCRSRLYRLQAVWSSAAHLSFLSLSFPIQEREILTLLPKRSIDIKLPEMRAVECDQTPAVASDSPSEDTFCEDEVLTGPPYAELVN